MKKNWKSILTISILGVLFLFSFYYFNRFITNRVEYQVRTSLEDVSIQNVVNIEKEIEQKFIDLNKISAKFQDLNTLDKKEIKEKVEQVMNWGGYTFQYFGVANENGVTYMSNGRIKIITDETYFQESMKGKNYISDTIEESNIYSVPIRKDGKVIGIVFGSQEVNSLENLLTIQSFHEEGYMYIIDDSGKVMIHSEKSIIYANDNMFENLLKEKRNIENVKKMESDIENGIKSSIKYTFQNQKKYAYYTPLRFRDWWLVTVVPYAVFDNRIMPVVMSTKIICGISFLIVILCIFLVYQKMSKHQKYLRELAYLDPLTEGYNKVYLKNNWKQEREKSTKKHSAILVFNVHKFRIINELYGSGTGDSLLKGIYFMIKRHLRKNGIVVHSQADEFVILYYYTCKEELIQWIDRLMEELYTISHENFSLKMEGTIGIYEIWNEETPFDKMYDYANMARKNAKEKNITYRFFDDTLRQNELVYKRQEDLIDKALEEKEFKAWFQPKYDTKEKKIIGAEALARWECKDGSLVPPNQFIPICEETGKILKLDRLIFEDVCIKLKQWIQEGKNIVPISINVSRAYLENKGVVEYLAQTVEKYGIPPQYIQLEITESRLIENEELLADMIQKMHAMGFQVLLDDYGVGYSSLKSINSMNFDILKIDKSFIDTIGTAKGNSIVQHTIALASSLGMRSVAEGVEDEEQYQFLLQCECDEIQGYYFSKPLSSQEFERLLEIN